MPSTTEPTLVPGYRHLPGNHCGSTALRNLLGFAGVELSEEMAFGLGAGAGFYYLALPDASPTRWFNGRTARLEESFRELTGAALEMRTFGEPEEGWEAARALIDGGRPALLLTDLYHLDYYGRSAHFPGHAVVLAGYDETEALLSDTGFEELQRAGLENLSRARFSGHPVYPLNGHLFTVAGEVDRDSLLAAVPGCGRAGGPPDARAGVGRGLRDAGGQAPRRRDRLLASGRTRLAVVRALRVPGDREAGHRGRQLQADVLALPRGGRLRGGPAGRRRGGGAGRRSRPPCSRRASRRPPSRQLWDRIGEAAAACAEAEERLWTALADGHPQRSGAEPGEVGEPAAGAALRGEARP